MVLNEIPTVDFRLQFVLLFKRLVNEFRFPYSFVCLFLIISKFLKCSKYFYLHSGNCDSVAVSNPVFMLTLFLI